MFPRTIPSSAARSKGITIWSEIELAYRFLEEMIGITGSNGKTTTTTLLHHILKAAGVETFMAGNVGTPLIACVERMTAGTVAVVELSSFQLELIERFRPDIGVYLNLTPDHLDRHKTIEAYAVAKARLFENQTELDAAVMNLDDEPPSKYAPEKAAGFLVQPEAAGYTGRLPARRRNSHRAWQGKEEFVMKSQRNSFARSAQRRKCFGRCNCRASGWSRGNFHRRSGTKFPGC